MRTSPLALLAVLAAVAPTFASSAAALVARTTSDPAAPVTSLTPEQSAALSLSTIGTIASVGGSIVSGIIDHFKNNGNQQQRRDALELEQLLSRAVPGENEPPRPIWEIVARQVEYEHCLFDQPHCTPPSYDPAGLHYIIARGLKGHHGHKAHHHHQRPHHKQQKQARGLEDLD